MRVDLCGHIIFVGSKTSRLSNLVSDHCKECKGTLKLIVHTQYILKPKVNLMISAIKVIALMKIRA